MSLSDWSDDLADVFLGLLPEDLNRVVLGETLAMVLSSTTPTIRPSSFRNVDPEKQYRKQLIEEFRTTPSRAKSYVSTTNFQLSGSESVDKVSSNNTG